jgi:transposase-like protein
MVVETITYRCTLCQNTNLRNKLNPSENPKYLCKDCNASKTLKLKIRHTEEQKELILKTYLER